MSRKDEIEREAAAHADLLTELSDVEGIIIRGHILVEREINRAIELLVVVKEEYKSDKFSFAQKLVMANMFDISLPLKSEINALNKLRNQIAHTLQYDDKLVDLIISGIEKKSPDAKAFKGPKMVAIGYAISYICGAIAAGHEVASLRITNRELKRLTPRVAQDLPSDDMS